MDQHAAGIACGHVTADLLSLGALDSGSAAGRERVRLAIANFGLAFFESDLAAGRLTLTPNAFPMFGLPTPPVLTAARTLFWDRYHPEDLGWARAAFEADLRGERGRDDYRERVRILRADDGALRWVEFAGHMFGPPGARTHIVGMLRDVTAEVEAEERRRLLAREVEHRAHNALAVVQALVRLTEADSLEAYRRGLERRILALARSQSLAAGAEAGGGGPPVTLATVLEAELGAYRDHLEAVAVERAPPLHPVAVQPVAMILHEWATNAAKHGALSRPGGQVRVEVRHEPGDTGLELRWTERGGPPLPAGPPARSGTGFGVVRAQARRLGAVLAQEWRAEGLAAALRVPLARWCGPAAVDSGGGAVHAEHGRKSM